MQPTPQRQMMTAKEYYYSEHIKGMDDETNGTYGWFEKMEQYAIYREQYISLQEQRQQEHKEMGPKVIDPLIKAFEDYQKLLVDELTEIVPLAHMHEWKSARHEEGIRLRKNIQDAIQAFQIQQEEETGRQCVEFGKFISHRVWEMCKGNYVQPCTTDKDLYRLFIKEKQNKK